MTSHNLLPVFDQGFLGAVGTFFLLGLGALLVIRTVFEKTHRPYLTPWAGSYLGEGFCLPVLMGLVAIMIDGRTPQAFYTQTWFYLVFFFVVYSIALFLSIQRARQEEANGRDPAIFWLWSELYHTFVVFPGMICLLAWSVFPAVDYHTWWVLLLACIPIAIWAGAFARDEKLETRPRTISDWTGVLLGVAYMGMGIYGALAYI